MSDTDSKRKRAANIMKLSNSELIWRLCIDNRKIIPCYNFFLLILAAKSGNATKSEEPPQEENDYVILVVIGVSGVIVIIVVVIVIVVKKRMKANSRGRRRPKVRYNKPSAGTSES